MQCCGGKAGYKIVFFLREKNFKQNKPNIINSDYLWRVGLQSLPCVSLHFSMLSKFSIMSHMILRKTKAMRCVLS